MGPTQKIVDKILFLEVFLVLDELATLSSKSRPDWPGQCVAPGWEASRRPPPHLRSVFPRIKNGGVAHHLSLFR